MRDRTKLQSESDSYSLEFVDGDQLSIEMVKIIEQGSGSDFDPNTLAKVARTNLYADLDGKPDLPLKPGSFTLEQLQTTHLAADNFPSWLTYCIDYGYVLSNGTQWVGVDGTVVSTDPGIPTSITIAPMTISLLPGEYTQLTAAVLPSTADQSVTWTSDATSVATVSSSGQVSVSQQANAGQVVRITATTANGKAATTVLTVKAAFNAVRLLTSTNRYPNRDGANYSGKERANASVYGHRTGGVKANGVILRAPNTYVWIDGLKKPASILTIKRIYVEINGVTVLVRWPGDVTATTVGVNSWLDSLPIPASEFGLDEISEGSTLDVRSEVSVPSGGVFPVVENWGTNKAGGHMYDPATVQCTNLGTPGSSLQYTGSVDQAQQSWTPIVLGTYVDGDVRSVIEIGDSILSGVGDTGTTGMGAGYAERARIGTDWATSDPGLNITRPAGAGYKWSNEPALVALVPLCNVCLEENATNNYSGTANIDPSGVGFYYSQSQDVHATFKANALNVPGALPMKVIRTEVGPRLINPPAGSALSQQVPMVQWSAGGNVDYLHTLVEADLAAGKIDVFFRTAPRLRASQVKGEDNYYKFIPAIMPPDGTHFPTSVVIPISQDLRAVYDSLDA